MQILKNTEQIAHKNFAQNLLNRNSPPYFISLSGTFGALVRSEPHIRRKWGRVEHQTHVHNNTTARPAER